MKNGIIYALFFTLLMQGCQSRYYNEGDFTNVLKIDSHTHINSDKGYFEETAKGNNFILITFNVDFSNKAGLEKQLKDATESVRRHPGRVFYGPTFFFDVTGWGTEQWNKNVVSYLDSAIAGGAVSVKLWKNIGMSVRDSSGRFIMVDDPLLDPVIEFIKSKGLPVTGHLGEPRNCWLPLEEMTVRNDSNYFSKNPQYHMYLHPDYPSYEDQISARDHLLQKNPDLRFIGCHLASLEWNVDSLADRLDKYPNLAVDMSARICHLQYQSALDRRKVRDFCIKYQDRLLYGTDTGDSGDENPEQFGNEMHKLWFDDWRYFTTKDKMTSDKFNGAFTGLHLPKEVVDKIFSLNAVKWYNLKTD